MKSIHLLLAMALSLTVNVSWSQTAERQVIAATGGTHTSESVRGSSTTGEPVTQTLSAEGIVLTQGFQQNDRYFPLNIIEKESGLKITAYPNPTSHMITIDIQSPEEVHFDCVMIDMQGKVILNRSIEQTGRHTINMESFASGSYRLMIQDESGELINAISVQKTY